MDTLTNDDANEEQLNVPPLPGPSTTSGSDDESEPLSTPGTPEEDDPQLLRQALSRRKEQIEALNQCNRDLEEKSDVLVVNARETLARLRDVREENASFSACLAALLQDGSSFDGLDMENAEPPSLAEKLREKLQSQAEAEAQGALLVEKLRVELNAAHDHTTSIHKELEEVTARAADAEVVAHLEEEKTRYRTAEEVAARERDAIETLAAGRARRVEHEQQQLRADHLETLTRERQRFTDELENAKSALIKKLHSEHETVLAEMRNQLSEEFHKQTTAAETSHRVLREEFQERGVALESFRRKLAQHDRDKELISQLQNEKILANENLTSRLKLIESQEERKLRKHEEREATRLQHAEEKISEQCQRRITELTEALDQANQTCKDHCHAEVSAVERSRALEVELTKLHMGFQAEEERCEAFAAGEEAASRLEGRVEMLQGRTMVAEREIQEQGNTFKAELQAQGDLFRIQLEDAQGERREARAAALKEHDTVKADLEWMRAECEVMRQKTSGAEDTTREKEVKIQMLRDSLEHQLAVCARLGEECAEWASLERGADCTVKQLKAELHTTQSQFRTELESAKTEIAVLTKREAILRERAVDAEARARKADSLRDAHERTNKSQKADIEKLEADVRKHSSKSETFHQESSKHDQIVQEAKRFAAVAERRRIDCEEALLQKLAASNNNSKVAIDAAVSERRKAANAVQECESAIAEARECSAALATLEKRHDESANAAFIRMLDLARDLAAQREAKKQLEAQLQPLLQEMSEQEANLEWQSSRISQLTKQSSILQDELQVEQGCCKELTEADAQTRAECRQEIHSYDNRLTQQRQMWMSEMTVNRHYLEEDYQHLHLQLTAERQHWESELKVERLRRQDNDTDSGERKHVDAIKRRCTEALLEQAVIDAEGHPMKSSLKEVLLKQAVIDVEHELTMSTTKHGVTQALLTNAHQQLLESVEGKAVKEHCSEAGTPTLADGMQQQLQTKEIQETLQWGAAGHPSAGPMPRLDLTNLGPSPGDLAAGHSVPIITLKDVLNDANLYEKMDKENLAKIMDALSQLGALDGGTLTKIQRCLEPQIDFGFAD